MLLADTTDWATHTFQHAKLGDPRRVKRLIQMASSLANKTGKSIVQSMHSPADIEAAYRFIRNPSISAEAIAEAGFSATVENAKLHTCMLALEDQYSWS